jgi:hypothetical protein
VPTHIGSVQAPSVRCTRGRRSWGSRRRVGRGVRARRRRGASTPSRVRSAPAVESGPATSSWRDWTSWSRPNATATAWRPCAGPPPRTAGYGPRRGRNDAASAPRGRVRTAIDTNPD